MRTPGEYFGLLAYLFVMNGGLPDPAFLWGPVDAADEAAEPVATSTRARRLRLVNGTGPNRRRKAARRSNGGADVDEAAA